MEDIDEIRIGVVVKWLLILLVVGLALDWVYAGQNFFLYRFWAPRQEAARREVYEHTKSYRQGSVQRLNSLCAQAANADDGHKSLLYDVINQEFAEWEVADVPTYLHSCLITARRK